MTLVVIEPLKSIDFKSFNNIKVWLRIVRTLLVSDKFLPWGGWKPTPTPTMILEKFHGIALMHVHQEIAPDIENVIDLFSVLNRTTFEFYWYLINIFYLL